MTTPAMISSSAATPTIQALPVPLPRRPFAIRLGHVLTFTITGFPIGSLQLANSRYACIIYYTYFLLKSIAHRPSGAAGILSSGYRLRRPAGIRSRSRPVHQGKSILYPKLIIFIQSPFKSLPLLLGEPVFQV